MASLLRSEHSGDQSLVGRIAALGRIDHLDCWILHVLRRASPPTLERTSAWAGVLIGMGGFQLFDGIIDHKVLRLHQIRYVENLLPYDLAWNGAAVVLLIVGLLLARRSRKATVEGAHTVR